MNKIDKLSNKINKKWTFNLWSVFVLILVTLLSITYFESKRIYNSKVELSEKKSLFQAQAFSENSLSNIKRINDYMLDLRGYVDENETNLENALKDIKRSLSKNNLSWDSDLSFQTAIVDNKGIVLESSIDKDVRSKKVDLSQREHIRVHLDNLDKDELYISKPVFGKISKKWSIQFTRKILGKNRIMLGVLVVSVSPDLFSNFHYKINGENEKLEIVVFNEIELPPTLGGGSSN